MYPIVGLMARKTFTRSHSNGVALSFRIDPSYVNKNVKYSMFDELLEFWTKLVLELDHPSYNSCTESLNCFGQPRELTMASQRSAVLLACGSFNPPTNMHLRLFGKLSLW